MTYSTPQPRRRLLAHPATLALSAAGSNTADVAAALNVSRGAVSQYLAGSRKPHPDLATALRTLIGEQAAAGVLALIPNPNEQPAA